MGLKISQVIGEKKTENQNDNRKAAAPIPAEYAPRCKHIRDHGQENAEDHTIGAGIKPTEKNAHNKGNTDSTESQPYDHWKQNVKIEVCKGTHIHFIKTQGRQKYSGINTGDNSGGGNGNTKRDALQQCRVRDLRKAACILMKETDTQKRGYGNNCIMVMRKAFLSYLAPNHRQCTQD